MPLEISLLLSSEGKEETDKREREGERH